MRRHHELTFGAELTADGLIANFALEHVPGFSTFAGRMVYSSAETGAPPGSLLSATFFILAPAPQ